MPRTAVRSKPRRERVFLVGTQLKGRPGLWTAEDSLEELAELARSAGAQVVGSMVQRLSSPTRAYLGKGKLQELEALVQKTHVDAVLCDDELTPTQQRSLEDALGGVKVLDRSALIIDIFARRARTREGRLQVELAQHEYLLPRLAGQWSHLERLGGGIGTRGPGESQLETDRRLVRASIGRLKKSLEDVRRHRGLYRARRREQQIPVVSLVGYTNAGKSTLLNALTGAGVPAEDRLFSTLDPVTRRVFLPSGREVLITDTVGFIQKLPATLLAAFRATLEEMEESALIVEVVDITHPNAAEQAQVVDQVLAELGLSAKPRVLVLNKIDLLPSFGDDKDGTLPVSDWAAQEEEGRAVFTSALRGAGLERLLARIDGVVADLASTAAPATA